MYWEPKGASHKERFVHVKLACQTFVFVKMLCSGVRELLMVLFSIGRARVPLRCLRIP